MANDGYKITDLSKKMSIKDVQNAVFSLFSTPIQFSEKENEATTSEEFILGELNER